MAEKSESKKGDSPRRSTQEIQADIEETRRRLAQNIDLLKQEVSPQALADRAKRKVSQTFVDPQSGALRTERVVAAAVVLVGILVVRRGFKVRARNRHLRQLSAVVWVPVPKTAVSQEFAPVARTAAELSPPLALLPAG